MKVVGSRAYLGTSVHRGGGCQHASWRGHLLILDLGNPTKPALLGQFVAGTGIRALHIAGDLAVLGGHEDGENHQYSFSLVDVSNPANPIELSVDHTLTGNAIASSGVALLRGGMGGRIKSAPGHRCRFAGGPGHDGDLPVRSDLLGHGDRGDPEICCASPEANTGPRMVRPTGNLRVQKVVGNSGSWENCRWHATPWGDASRRPLRLSGHGSPGVAVIDLNDPTKPVIAGSYETPGLALVVHVAVDGGIALVADYSGGST